ncbi:hypothetical protein AB6A40_001012 [Gnathostoma spinigerum]|uniref:Carboxylesterase type B domain-containing protein n=1 Tax=Gnathostoma spinigerum TaxID=75299 RepID=A0ABD6E383_9BILA
MDYWRRQIRIWIIILFALRLPLIVECYVGLKSVTTTFGVIRGETVSPAAGDLPPVTQYLGIPYGVAPSGQYRFNMAISAAKWTHLPKEAVKLSPVCIQSGMPELSEARALRVTSAQRYDYIHRLLLKLKPQSEDCLHMNLFVPERIVESSRTRLPAMVVVHGDEYGWNAGNPYNGSYLASHGQIIVVTVNYRLGVFGFLGRCESNTCTGNSALSDLVAALKMLSNILPAFGGDPSSVTLLGWGSGASMVSLLMASPITQPNNRLFRRAILLDGSALCPWAMIANPQRYFFQLAENLECVDIQRISKRPSKPYKSVENIVRCMQDHSPQNVTKAAMKITVPTFLSAFAPIVDGQIVPNQPKTLFGAQFGALFREIDLMVGLASNPAHHLLSNEYLLEGIDSEQREKIFRTLVRNLYDYHRTEILAAITSEYTDWDNPKNHPKTIRSGVLAALSDVLFTVPSIETARLHSLEGTEQTSRTYMFHFAHETRHYMEEQPHSGIRGSLSGDYLPYIFGYPLSETISDSKLYGGFSSEDRGLTRALMHYISNFVKSGDPLRPVPMSATLPVESRFHSTSWPQFNQITRESYLEISDRPRVKNYYRNERVGFWNGFIPQLHNPGHSDIQVPEEHHFLPHHFKRDSFFGHVRPYASYANDPFPPPPIPPAPIPKELIKTTVQPKPVETDKTVDQKKTPVRVTSTAQYSTMLSVTVAVGCGFLFLNICVFLGLYRQCDRQKRSKKKFQLQYQTYTGNHQPNIDAAYGMSSPMNPQMSLMSLPPPPPVRRHTTTASGLMTNKSMEASLHMDQNPYNSFSAKFNEARLNNNKTSATLREQGDGTAMRSGVSPTCPRHGRAALAMGIGTSRKSVNGNSGSGPTLEEIEV